jgi:hypothetical protein
VACAMAGPAATTTMPRMATTIINFLIFSPFFALLYGVLLL